MSALWSLAVTECDEEANVFRTLGGAAWLSRQERDSRFENVPESVEPSAFCLDVIDPDGSIVADRAISEETACGLLGVDGLAPLRFAAERATTTTEEGSR